MYVPVNDSLSNLVPVLLCVSQGSWAHYCLHCLLLNILFTFFKAFHLAMLMTYIKCVGSSVKSANIFPLQSDLNNPL